MRFHWIVPALLACNLLGADRTIYVSISGSIATYGPKQIAGKVFQKAGVHVIWSSSRDTTSDKWLHVELQDWTAPDQLPGALGVSYPFRSCSRKITVFLDRVRAMTHTPTEEAALLAYVIVHEITHVIQRTDRHSESGVMKAHWDPLDRLEIFAHTLPLLDDDILLVHRQLDKGWCQDADTLIGRYVSRNVARPE